MPAVFCIYKHEHRVDTYEFIRKLNFHAIHNAESILVDMREVKEITAAASVLLFAAAYTAQQWYKNPSRVRFRFPTKKDNEVGHRYIVKTGLARALHAGTPDDLDELAKSDSYFQSSTSLGVQLNRTLDLLTKEVSEITGEQFDLLTAGIGEAMLNVQHHAYKSHSTSPSTDIENSKWDLVEKVGERWWQCAWYDRIARSWVFIICDLGVGIPKSYANLQPNDSSNSVLRSIEEAFLVGNSRFFGLGRGNGSEDMKRPIKLGHNINESLQIYSSNASYYYQSNMSEPAITLVNDFFSGTLVEWCLYPDK